MLGKKVSKLEKISWQIIPLKQQSIRKFFLCQRIKELGITHWCPEYGYKSRNKTRGVQNWFSASAEMLQRVSLNCLYSRVATPQNLKQKSSYACSRRIIKPSYIRWSDSEEAASHNDINLSPQQHWQIDFAVFDTMMVFKQMGPSTVVPRYTVFHFQLKSLFLSENPYALFSILSFLELSSNSIILHGPPLSPTHQRECLIYFFCN